MNAMDYIPYENDTYHVFDRGYVDFTHLYRITQLSAFFVVRAKSNLNFERMYSSMVDKSTGVMCDQFRKLKGFYVSWQYLEKVRRVKFNDAEFYRTFFFLTNNMELKALQIAFQYKN